MFSCFLSLPVRSCTKLKNLSWVETLYQLEYLSIEYCQELASIIASESRKIDDFIFNNMSTLILRKNLALESIFGHLLRL